MWSGGAAGCRVNGGQGEVRCRRADLCWVLARIGALHRAQLSCRASYSIYLLGGEVRVEKKEMV